MNFAYKMSAQALFRAAVFFKLVSTKIRGSSTTTTNAEAMLIKTNACEVINHVQLTLFYVLGHKRHVRVDSSTIKAEFVIFGI